MTITQARRNRSPKSFLRKDARNLIYRAMYGEGDRRSTSPAAYDPNRRRPEINSVDWHSVQAILLAKWSDACFDELTANKIVSDFNHYAKGSIELTRAELEEQP
jgi:hypothetical protein